MGLKITYNSRDGHYIVYTKDGKVHFIKDDMGLYYINAKNPHDVGFVHNVWENLKV